MNVHTRTARIAYHHTGTHGITSGWREEHEGYVILTLACAVAEHFGYDVTDSPHKYQRVLPVDDYGRSTGSLWPKSIDVADRPPCPRIFEAP